MVEEHDELRVSITPGLYDASWEVFIVNIYYITFRLN
jgi:hypothetical protein